MSTSKLEAALQELRRAAPPAPDRLRAQVREIATPPERPRLSFRWRPALVIAATSVVAIGLGGAALNGLRSALDTPAAREKIAGAGGERARAGSLSRMPVQGGSVGDSSAKSPRFGRPPFSSTLTADARTLAPHLNSRRLQRQDVFMSLRVRDLSKATQDAVRQTRRLGGYVAAADYSIGGDRGDSTLELRVPISRVQVAIARFTDLGTILSQRISVADLQAGVDRIDQRLATAQRVIAELESNSFRTPAEQARLDAAKRTVKRLLQGRQALVREGTYAKVSLQLTTNKPAAKDVKPGRFDRFWGDAGDILGKEAIAVLYALVVAGPFAILAALALLAERARRRRADHRLLGETG